MEQPNGAPQPDKRRALILDLDFTLLHLESVPGSIEVPGRTRSAFVAPATIVALRALQDRFAIFLATARSWEGARWVSDGLKARGISVSASILEDGALLHASQQLQPLEEYRDWNDLRQELDSRRLNSWPCFEWQHDFQSCLVARAESRERCKLLMDAWLPILQHWNANGRDLRMFRDGRKLYVSGRGADKWSALCFWLGERASEAAGVGDGANDICWLQHIALPCTMPHAAPQVLATVRAQGGFVSRHEGHAGIQEVLDFIKTQHLIS